MVQSERRGSDNVKIQLGPQPKGVPAFSQSINIHIYYTTQLSVDKVLALAPLGSAWQHSVEKNQTGIVINRSALNLFQFLLEFLNCRGGHLRYFPRCCALALKAKVVKKW